MTKPKTLAEALGVEGTLVMPDEQAMRYAFERKLADPETQRELFEAQLRGIKGIVIHNAKTEGEVRTALSDAKLSPVEYKPPKSTEAHFYARETGYIHVVNSRGITRLRRDESLAKALQYFLPQPIAVDVSNHEHHRRKANDRFELFAFNLVDDIFTNMDKGMVSANGRVNLLFGPHGSIDDALNSADVRVVHGTSSDYLNYRIVVVATNGKPELVVNFDYIFADQAKDVLHKFYKGMAAEFSRQDIDVHVLHYGKVGILDPATNVGDLVVPVGAIDEEKLQSAVRSGELVPPNLIIKNQLASNPKVREIFYALNEGRIHTGLTVNTNSVLEQTVQSLQTDLQAGGLSLDMEWIVMASLDAGSESTYPGIGTIRYFFAGVGSDKPLKGQTLGNTEYPGKVEQKVADSLLKIIGQSHDVYGTKRAPVGDA